MLAFFRQQKCLTADSYMVTISVDMQGILVTLHCVLVVMNVFSVSQAGKEICIHVFCFSVFETVLTQYMGSEWGVQ